MPRNFSWPSYGNGAERQPRLGFPIAIGALVLMNAVALYLYFLPPGGSRRDLITEIQQVRHEIGAARAKAVRLKTVSDKVQTGSSQSSDFQTKYVLPERLAYGILITEIERMVKDSGLQERDAVYSKEPIEGTADLTLLTSAANYEGTYENLKKFLYEVDHSPLLIMVDTIQATPQQKGNQINTNIRFQAVIRDDAGEPMKGQP
jgi:Tfp pilus assembly protein PilO